MSLKRVCDCDCHDDGEGAIMWEGEEYATFGGKDVCAYCLHGENGCRRWQPFVKPEPTELERQVIAIYSPVIAKQLKNDKRFMLMRERNQ